MGVNLMDAKAKVVAKQIRWQDRDGGWERWLDMGDYDPNGYSGNIPYETRELIPLTDHEAALAELRAEWRKCMGLLVEQGITFGKVKNENATLLTQHNVLLAGLEALAGEWEDQARYFQDGTVDEKWCAAARMNDAHDLRDRIRTLASSATGEKNTEEGGRDGP